MKFLRRGDVFDLPKSKIFFVGGIFFLFGLGIASYFNAIQRIANIAYFGIALFFLIGTILFWRIKKIKIVFIVFFCFFLGIWRYNLSEVKIEENDIAFYNSRTIRISGLVSEMPENKNNQQRIKLDRIKLVGYGKETISKPLNGRLLIFAKVYPAYQYGDILEINGRLDAPAKVGEFSYDRYLARYGIYSTCYSPQIRVISHQGNIFYEYIFLVREKIKQIFRKNLSFPESELALGILIGDVSAFSEEMNNAFSRTGLTHLVAVSGQNITILSALIMNILFFFGMGRRPSFYLSIITIIVYVLLVGAPASALRAGLMGFLVLWALYLGRINRAGNALVLAAVIMLLFNPKLLRDDIGFQLSFLAMASIVYLYPLLDGLFEKIKLINYGGLREAISLTLSAQFFCTPLIAYYFFQISLVSFLANILVAWASSILMALLLATLALSLISGQYAFIIFLPAFLLLKYIIFIAEFFSGLSWSSVEIIYFSPVYLFIYYFILILIIFYNQNRNKKQVIC